MKRSFAAILSSAILTIVVSVTVQAQRDYFTPEEVELIRQAQAIDARVAVLTHAIDRRFEALGLDVAAPKLPTRDETLRKQQWGELPKESRSDLFLDIRRILQKAIDDIDDVDEHSSIDKQTEKNLGGALFPKAVRTLASAATRYEPALKAAGQSEKDGATQGSILDSLESCDEILEAVAKLPADVPASPTKH